MIITRAMPTPQTAITGVSRRILAGQEIRTRQCRGPDSTMHMYPIDGAVRRVPADATAFAHRDGGWAGIIAGVDPDPANAGLISQWAKDYWQELHPTSAGGAYINFMMNEGQDRIKAFYRGNYQRLAQVKNRYDPDNIFHINQNILPASEPSP